MTAVQNRAGQRLNAVPLDLELPVIDAPQYVNEDGYEIDAQSFALALQNTARRDGHGESMEQEIAQLQEEAQEALLDVDEEPDAGDVAEGEQAAELGEPLLGLAESNLLHYSLVAARQHHLQSLLPHVFTHPAISANARPRARAPPKNTFLYPTPPPLVHPLPHREYHAPLNNGSQASTSAKAPDEPEVKRRKYGRKGKGRAEEAEAPAHDIECVARVTLSIGPISFPDTEIWVGRFVQPRAAAPKPARMKLDPIEKQRLKDERNAAKRARQSVPPTTTYPPSYRPPYHPPMAGPSNQGYRPRPPAHAPPGTARPPPQQRAELSPDLIRRVNEAATRHPWLSQIIHKAARTQATKEELAKLGRVVNRLKDGKDIEEDGDPGQGQAGTSQALPGIATGSGSKEPPSHGPVSASGSAPAAADSPKSVSDALTPPPEDNSDSDDSGSDVDMTGPEQVGGGPAGAEDPAASVKSATQIPPPAPNLPPAQASSFPPPQFLPPQPHPMQSAPIQRDSSSFASPPPPMRPHAYPQAPLNPAMMSRPPYMPMPARPSYPLPPPFLLVAFKEAPTEKFLLPLGSLSYLSRVGEREDQPIPQRSNSESSAVSPMTPSEPVSATSKKTRASTVRGSEGQAMTATPAVEVRTEPRLDASAPTKTTKSQPTSGLCALPGTVPPAGTVLISTFTPAGEWQKPDWHELGQFLPFNNPLFGRAKPPPTDSEKRAESTPDPPQSTASSTDESTRSTAKEPPVTPAALDSVRLPAKSPLLNIAAEPMLPHEGVLHAVTIRLSDVSDHTWQRLKTINGMIIAAEMKALADQNPHLMPPPPPLVPPFPGSQATGQQMSAPGAIPFQPSDLLRKEYLTRKRNHFRRLLTRVPPRRFLRYRLETARPDIIEATTDKWAPKPYIISTKATGNRENDYDDQNLPVGPEIQHKKGNKKAIEPEVTFEMPVSLDQLDEMVAENALKGKKGKGEDGRKGKGRRWVPGTICQGCGLANKRVWRSGPGGKGTLCNSCGDKFTAGELGTLAAPGVADVQEEPKVSDSTGKPDGSVEAIKEESEPLKAPKEATFEAPSVPTQARPGNTIIPQVTPMLIDEMSNTAEPLRSHELDVQKEESLRLDPPDGMDVHGLEQDAPPVIQTADGPTVSFDMSKHS